MKNLFKLFIILFLIVVVVYNIQKIEKVYYIPFNIPGTQMASTVPPFGIFIEEKYKKDKDILNHEKIHWKQYKEMGLIKFYTTYTYEYIKYGRVNGPMEVEARKLSKIKKYN